MKKLNILLTCFIALFIFVACSNDDDHIKLNEDKLISPTLTEFESQQNFVVTASTNQKDVIGNIKWTEASFGINSPVTYAIVADTLESMATEVQITTFSTFDEKQDITIEMLNGAASSMTKESKPVKLYVAVKAFLGTTGNIAALYTAVKSVSFTCYFFNPKNPLYIVGDGLVGWGNDVANIGKDLQVFFANNSGKADLIYTYTGFFHGGKGLKFPTLAGDWDKAYGTNGATLVPNGGGDYITPATDGLYTLTANLNTLSVSMTPYTGETKTYTSIGIVGDAANGWPGDDNITDIEMTQVVAHVWVATDVDLKADKVMKFRAEKKWDTNWGAPDEQELPFALGKPNGADIKISKSGKYYIALNDLTGHYAIILADDLPKKND